MNCSKCNKPINGKIYPEESCQACYNYYHKGGTDNLIPPKGKIAYDHRGYVVCHICGRAYKRLGSAANKVKEYIIDDKPYVYIGDDFDELEYNLGLCDDEEE